jgi:hypothetical protein
MVRRDAMELFVEPLRCSKSDDRRGACVRVCRYSSDDETGTRSL